MRELAVGLVLGTGIGLVCMHGSVKRALCRACIDPSICEHDRCRGEEEDAMRRERYGFMA